MLHKLIQMRHSRSFQKQALLHLLALVLQHPSQQRRKGQQHRQQHRFLQEPQKTQAVDPNSSGSKQMTETQGVAIRLMQGASLSQTAVEGEEMGRGTGNFWAAGTVRVLNSEF